MLCLNLCCVTTHSLFYSADDEEENEIVDEEEFKLLRDLKALKKKYRDQYEELKVRMEVLILILLIQMFIRTVSDQTISNLARILKILGN